MSGFFYKSSEPAIVSIVREFYAQKEIFLNQLVVLGTMFGGKVAPMRDVDSNFAGGVKLTSGREYDLHWCRPDDHGYRTLRAAAKPGKGIPKEKRAAIRAEHERLIAMWNEHCPKRLSNTEYWDRLGVNSGSLWLCGGIKFELDGTAYFHLGFQINKAEHHSNVAEGQPSSGWIDGAVEILASEFQAARAAKLKAVEVSNA